MEKYYEKKAIRNGALRRCKSCSARLSRYNQQDICAGCEKKSLIRDRNKIVGRINEIS
jgi:hypothetical protein